MLVCDLTALDPNKRHQQELDQLGHEECKERERAERELGKHIRGLFAYFRKKIMIKIVKAETLSEISLVDMTPVTEFRRRNTYKDCQHRSEFVLALVLSRSHATIAESFAQGRADHS